MFLIFFLMLFWAMDMDEPAFGLACPSCFCLVEPGQRMVLFVSFVHVLGLLTTMMLRISYDCV